MLIHILALMEPKLKVITVLDNNKYKNIKEMQEGISLMFFNYHNLNLKDNSQNLILRDKLFLHFIALNCTRGKVDLVECLGCLLQKI